MQSCFIKLNTRSAKDVTVYDFENEKMKELIVKEIERIPKEKRTANEEVSAFVVASQLALKVESGGEAMQLFCKSQRIYEDLSKILKFGKALFQSKIVLRKWIEEVPRCPESEFRAFVHNNSLVKIFFISPFSIITNLFHKERNVRLLLLCTLS